MVVKNGTQGESVAGINPAYPKREQPTIIEPDDDCSPRLYDKPQSFEKMSHDQLDREERHPVGRMLPILLKANARFGHYIPAFVKRRLRDKIIPRLSASEEKLIIPQTTLPGVNLVGYIRAEMGLGEGARGDAKALTAINEPFGVINFEAGSLARMGDRSLRHKETVQPIYDINLLHINADFIGLAHEQLSKEFFQNRYNIGYWAWELPDFPDEWRASFDMVDEVWVPSSFVHQAVSPKATVPVTVIPHVVEINPDKEISRAYFQLPEDRFLFLTMCDMESVPKRKNSMGAIEAFQKVFSPTDDHVGLVIKINNILNRSTKMIRKQIQGYGNIYLIERVLSRKEVSSLIAVTDSFVSLHRAEGFGLGPAEAMSLGKAAILTGWSGNTDYMTEDNCIGIDYKLVKLGRDYGFYKSHQTWAEPDINQASQAMKRLVDEPEWGREMGRKAQMTIQKHFSAISVGQKMKKRIEEIRAGQVPNNIQVKRLTDV